MKTLTLLLTLYCLSNFWQKQNNIIQVSDFSAKKKIKTNKITFAQWEAFEKGLNTCKSFIFYRDPAATKWLLEVPCGGTQTSVSLFKKSPTGKMTKAIQKLSITHQQCPPVFDLTKLPDGEYGAVMIACGLGGAIEFSLKTKR